MKLSKPCYRFVACQDGKRYYRRRVLVQLFTYRDFPFMVDHRLDTWVFGSKKKIRRWVVSHEGSGLKFGPSHMHRKNAIADARETLDWVYPKLAEILARPSTRKGIAVIKRGNRK